MNKFLDYQIIQTGNYILKAGHLFNLCIFLIAVIIVLALIKKAIYRSTRIDLPKKFSINRLVQYIVVILAFLFSLRILGFDITVLLAGSAALLVGLGFGMQHLFNDFLSGIILLLDGTIKVGDIIEVNNMIFRVERINFRTTRMIGRDENYVIMPNSELTGNRVVNWTYERIASRFKISVGLDYSTDPALIEPLLKKAALSHPKVLKEPGPFVRFEDFGDSALLFSLFFYTEEIFRVESIKSNIRMKMLELLRENGIQIPFPQRVVHMRPPSA